MSETPAGDPTSGPGSPPPSYGTPPPGFGQPASPQPTYQQPSYQQPYQQPYPPQGYAAPAPLSPADERTWAMFAHLSGLVAGLVGLSFVGPLVIWLVYKDRSEFVRRNAVEALNFHITLWGLSFVLVAITFVTLFIGAIVTVPLMIIVGLGAIIVMILAGVAASRGEEYRYPLTVRLVK